MLGVIAHQEMKRVCGGSEVLEAIRLYSGESGKFHQSVGHFIMMKSGRGGNWTIHYRETYDELAIREK